MLKYTVEREIAVLEDRGHETVELNLIKWGNNQAKYDLRRWNEDGEPLKGITLSEDAIEELYRALSEELGYGSRNDEDEEWDTSSDEEKIEDDAELQTIDYRSFFVMKSMDECDEKEHDYSEVIATVPMMIDDEFEDIEFPAIYCKDCNVYYVSEQFYNELKSRGKVLCQMLTEDEYRRYLAGIDFGELSPKGPLILLGYTVARDKNGEDILSSSERKQLLDWIIGNEIMTKRKWFFI